MSFGPVEHARLKAAGGAALRKYDRLVRHAEGAQHGSPAMLAKQHFEHHWQINPDLVQQEAEAEEAAIREAEEAAREAAEEWEDEDEDEPEPKPHGRTGKKR